MYFDVKTKRHYLKLRSQRMCDKCPFSPDMTKMDKTLRESRANAIRDYLKRCYPSADVDTCLLLFTEGFFEANEVVRMLNYFPAGLDLPVEDASEYFINYIQPQLERKINTLELVNKQLNDLIDELQKNQKR